jgi:hypothetical protein
MLNNRAMQFMNERRNMIEEANEQIRDGFETLAILKATEEEMMYQAPKTNITINKGKIIEVEVTKEIVKEVANEELQKAYDQLAADYANRCERIDQLKLQLEKEQQDYRDLEYEANEEIEAVASKRDQQIKELQEELADKELLLNDFRAALDEQIEAKLQLKDELEIKDALIENLRARLRVAEQNQRVIYVERDEEVENTEEETAVADDEPEISKGGDAMSSFINIPDEFMNNKRIKELLKYYTDKLNEVTADKIVFGKPFTVEQQKRIIINKANDELEKAMSQCVQSDSHKLTVDEIVRANGVTALFGKITLGGKEYAFKYDATFELPVVYGCMNMDLIHEAKAVLDGLGRLDRDENNLGQKHVNAVKYDFENNIVVWISDDGCFKGYTDKYAFVWDPSHAQPCGITVINALSNFKRYRKMNASWGNGFVARAKFIMDYCRQMETKTTKEKEPEYTNEVVVDFSTPQNTNDEVVSEWDDIDM